MEGYSKAGYFFCYHIAGRMKEETIYNGVKLITATASEDVVYFIIHAGQMFEDTLSAESLFLHLFHILEHVLAFAMSTFELVGTNIRFGVCRSFAATYAYNTIYEVYGTCPLSSIRTLIKMMFSDFKDGLFNAERYKVATRELLKRERKVTIQEEYYRAVGGPENIRANWYKMFEDLARYSRHGIHRKVVFETEMSDMKNIWEEYYILSNATFVVAGSDKYVGEVLLALKSAIDSADDRRPPTANAMMYNSFAKVRVIVEPRDSYKYNLILVPRNNADCALLSLMYVAYIIGVLSSGRHLDIVWPDPDFGIMCIFSKQSQYSDISSLLNKLVKNMTLDTASKKHFRTGMNFVKTLFDTVNIDYEPNVMELFAKLGIHIIFPTINGNTVIKDANKHLRHLVPRRVLEYVRIIPWVFYPNGLEETSILMGNSLSEKINSIR
jgi:hypothetical protein